jgi:hypothetical protein
MSKSAHLFAITVFSGLAAAAFTVDLAGLRAESPLQFLRNQARQQERSSQPSYSEAVPVRGGEGFFGDFFDFEMRGPARPRAPVSSNLQRVVCKRQCDGAQFVMGFMPARSRQKEAEAMCVAAGGGAETQLVLEKFTPGVGFAPAVQTASAAPLLEGRAALDTSKPDEAPKATSSFGTACPKSIEREAFMTVPILHDATLRNGDVVATRGGFKVFVGNGKPPFKEKDFVALDQRKRVSADLRQLKVAGN